MHYYGGFRAAWDGHVAAIKNSRVCQKGAGVYLTPIWAWQCELYGARAGAQRWAASPVFPPPVARSGGGGEGPTMNPLPE